MSGPSSALTAITGAMSLLAAAGPAATPFPNTPNRNTTPTGTPIVLPSSVSRRAVDSMARAADPHALETQWAADGTTLKKILSDALDWDEPKFTRATKTVTRVIGAALVGTTPDGHPSFHAAVEMVSFLSVCAPLLEPDRLGRIAELATHTHAAFAPIRYPLGTAGQLRQLLSGYPQARREQLLASLWTASHDGRWWAHTTGDKLVRADGHRITNRRNRAADAEEAAAIREHLDAILQGGETPTARLITEAITTRTLGFSTEAYAVMRTTPVPAIADRRALLAALATSGDEDHRVLITTIPWLTPTERPESPVPTMVAVLLTRHGGPQEFTFATHMEPDSTEWADLYPATSREPFPLPGFLCGLHNKPVPGLPGVDMHVCSNADLLKRNAAFMGNCTFSYLSRCQQGQVVIVRVEHAGTAYNAALQLGSGRVTIGETNSRFNRGEVPASVTSALTALATRLSIPNQ